MIARLKNPAPLDSPIGKALTKTGLVHFASMSTIDAGSPGSPKLFLLLELNADGDADAALNEIVPAIEPYIGDIFSVACPSMTSLRRLLGNSILKFTFSPTGATGLEFDGTGEFTVRAIQQQKDLADFTRTALEYYTREHAGIAGRALSALEFVRALIRQDNELLEEAQMPGLRAQALQALLDQGQRFSEALVLPTGSTLKFAQWEAPQKWPSLGTFNAILKTKEGKLATVAFTILLFILTLINLNLFFNKGNHYTIDIFQNAYYTETIHPRIIKSISCTINSLEKFFFSFLHGKLPPLEPQDRFFALYIAIILWLIDFFFHFLFALGASLIVETVAITIISAIAIGIFRLMESLDSPDDQTPPLSTIESIQAVENARGYAQNHFMSVTTLKPGILRRIALSVSLFGIQLVVANQFRPGFVTAMGTIHYARWFRVPKTDKLVFLSNFDGSWESYLEDFIMRVHQGQSAAWSNGVGFPRTRNLIQDGAEDGDRFKRWVRRQQRIAPFWYSRFPDLTTDLIRNNALIQHGLARAQNETSARAWLKCFGTMQRPDNTIETDEVQSLTFGAMGDLPYGALVILELPNEPLDRHAWLRGMMPETAAPDVTPIRFGDVPESQRHHNSAATILFSAEGLEMMGLPQATSLEGLGTFPGAFNIGMRGRSRVLGDDDHKPWLWSDKTGHAALIIYWRPRHPGQTLNTNRQSNPLDHHLTHLLSHGGRAIAVVPTKPTDVNRDPIRTIDGKPVQNDRNSTEHFGFRDNISQPIISGTQSSFLGALTRDIVMPGEFLFGYPNSQGYFPPSPTVRSTSDRKKFLPVPVKATKVGEDGGAKSNPPDFDAVDPSDDWRDFGRNGTFVAIRQLIQKVDEFNEYTNATAAHINEQYPRVSDTVGGPVTAEWVAAKLMGRWRNGTPLVYHPQAGRTPTTPDSRNDFSYGDMDPIGLKCPLGSHIRRANPRDSLHAGDPKEQAVTNRHRIIRRGRSYQSDDGEKGLIFVALCADLERQFELVQQTWINSRAFHGLSNETDPIASAEDPNDFTIPTAAGPIVLHNIQKFVELKAGGYFFMPSRSALRYLIALAPAAEPVPTGGQTPPNRETLDNWTSPTSS
jgi:deferrochelatase/peroxidase EfeB